MRIPAKALPCLLFCLACVTVLPASASELSAASTHATPGPLKAAYGHADTAQPTLQRHLRFDEGAQVARRRAKVRHAAPKVAASAAHDTSNRFLMTQNGKQMTADDFEAWMKARGIRVAKGTPESAKAAE